MRNRLAPRVAVESICPDPQQGLSGRVAKERLAAGWSNRTKTRAGLTEGQILLHHCVTFFNFVFLVMALFLALCGSSVQNMTFMMVVIINAVIGCVQQIRAKRAVDQLTLVAAQTVTCIRDSQALTLPSDLLVLDDIVEFRTGDQICADGILRTGTLQVNEALLTGEADPITKSPGDSLLSGSFVVAGTGRAQLTQVGSDTFAAQLAAEAKKDPKATKSQMMRSLDKLIRVMSLLLIPIGIVLFYHEYQTLATPLRGSAEGTVAALVGMIPQGLYLLTSVALAASAIQLSRRRVLVQDMNCIEALARVDVLCVDKTGTITEPIMAVEQVIALTDTPPEPILTALYGSREPENDTGRAIRAKFPGESPWECTRYIPFTAETKWCGGSFDQKGSYLCGAPEWVLGNQYETLAPAIEEWSAKGYRVLLLAGCDALPQPSRVTPLALVLLTNQIRESAPATFRYFREQGVTVKVISGDNPATVSQVARRAGIPQAERYIDATTLLTEDALFQAAEAYTVFGRVTPAQKKQLILAMKQQGHTVGMTGDGVNDVLALKEADCGIAMAGGAQAASQVARLVLLDGDFSAMPSIVNEGRRVINNIQRAAALFIVKNIFSFTLAILTLFSSWSFPLQPFHLTLISCLTIGAPAFFLAMEPNYARIRGKFLPTVLRKALPGGITNVLVVAAILLLQARFQIPHIETLCTAVLATVGLLVLLQISRPMGWFRWGIWLVMAAGLVLSFTVLGRLFSLNTAGILPYLPLLLAGTLAVFLAVLGLFALGDRLFSKK